MGPYQVSREIETVATGKASSTGVAKSNAEDDVRAALDAADGADALTIAVDAADVYEFPTAPFDPYRITVAVDLVTAVEAADEQSAVVTGDEEIGDVLAAADLDEWEYVTDATLRET